VERVCDGRPLSHISFFVEIFLGPTDHVEPEVSYLVRILVGINADVVARSPLDAEPLGIEFLRIRVLGITSRVRVDGLELSR
jgi:hypothetical protein